MLTCLTVKFGISSPLVLTSSLRLAVKNTHHNTHQLNETE
ncbi:hypothetical protein BFV94_4186 [Alteromonas macleodii]|uniref:Uncharacterized protein n=1 Tax=Alteromonas macleodii TaxID=28108 RepID=A0AB36FSL2_ALTMA|nr:hypothetical protein BFV95_4196 [Alteromonas macleodii]OES26416.1 hypothetical protein BFV94_4186 [Alteromonas macleodii]OES39203.1 hypothetical protein BFV96_4176 [Alteromonas macleodii]